VAKGLIEMNCARALFILAILTATATGMSFVNRSRHEDDKLYNQLVTIKGKIFGLHPINETGS
jgi:hypothetical protein